MANEGTKEGPRLRKTYRRIIRVTTIRGSNSKEVTSKYIRRETMKSTK